MTMNSTLRRPGRYRFRFCIRRPTTQIEITNRETGKSVLLSQRNNRRAQPASFRRRVSPIDNKRRSAQYRPYHLTLHANSFTMNNSDAAKPQSPRFTQILLNYKFYVPRLDGMQIEDIRDRNSDRLRKGIERI